MDKTENRIFTRQVLVMCPDGHGVIETERCSVQIIWPENMESYRNNGDYVVCGEWKLVPNEKN